MQGIQKTIYEIIKTSKEQKLPYITTRGIIEEAKKTSLGEFAKKPVLMNGVPDLEYDQLTAKVWQALQNLKNKDAIRSVKHGHWTIKAHNEKYSPNPCKALIPEYKQKCSDEKCDWFDLQVGEEKPKKRTCPKCGKSTTIEFNRWHCPVRNMFIAKPEAQCELLHGTDATDKVKKVTPMKPCYFNKTPSKLEVEYMTQKVRILAQQEELELRKNAMNIHDPESKNYLPKLHQEVQ